jgi:hypothetical protein
LVGGQYDNGCLYFVQHYGCVYRISLRLEFSQVKGFSGRDIVCDFGCPVYPAGFSNKVTGLVREPS